MGIYLEIAIALILGFKASITDFKNKKILNKNIIICLILSMAVYIIFFKSFDLSYVLQFIINFIIGIIISFLFYIFKLWSAGDAKLFIALTFIIPVELYEVTKLNVFPSLNLLIIIFSIAFIYIVFDTIYFFIKDKNKLKIETDEFNLKESIVDYFLGYFIILFTNNIIYEYFEEFSFYNQSLLMVLNMLILIFFYQVIKNRKLKLAVIFIMILANILYYLMSGFVIYSINIKMLLIVVSIMIFRKVSEKYNYSEIAVTALKPRMILSYGSVLKFYGSNVKGLPISTTESTDSRLTLSEVESIKRWSKTKKGEENITIVRHMPFAPFVFVGELVFIILKLY